MHPRVAGRYPQRRLNITTFQDVWNSYIPKELAFLRLNMSEMDAILFPFFCIASIFVFGVIISIILDKEDECMFFGLDTLKWIVTGPVYVVRGTVRFCKDTVYMIPKYYKMLNKKLKV